MAAASVCLSLCPCGAIARANSGSTPSTSSRAAEYVEGASYQSLPSLSSNLAWVGFLKDPQWRALIGFAGLLAILCFASNKPERNIELTSEDKLETLRWLWDKDR